MTNDIHKNVLASNDALQRHLKPLSERIKALELESDIRRIIEDTDRTRNLVRAILGPAEILRQGHILDTVPTVGAELDRIHSLSLEFERQFRLPLLPEIPNLLRELKIDRTVTALAHYNDHIPELSRAIEAMTTPWLNKQEQIRSLTGFFGLQEIGYVLNKKSILSIESEERLRSYLGDWRGHIDWPFAIFTDPVERSEFYVSRGLDLTLTEFPVAAFDEAITIAGIKRSLPSRIDAYDYTHKRESDNEVGLKRNNTAHDRLQRFESHIRSFIDQRMTVAVGENWIKHRVSGEIRQQWKEKRDKADENGELERPLIDYADFTDYEEIIVRNDNWEEVFAPIFQRKTLVQESFQRLYPIRICTMHARIITQDDELYLFTETRRLLKAIGIVN